MTLALYLDDCAFAHELRDLLIAFEALHTAHLDAGGHHTGIFAIYQDNDPRDMSNQEIVAAIANAETWYADTGFVDLFLSLNACR